MKRQLLTIALAACVMTPIAAQEPPQEKPGQTAVVSQGNQVPLKVQFVLSRFKGEQKVSSTPYMLGVLSNAQKTSLRMGIQVPVVQTVFGAKAEGAAAMIPQTSYTYRDVGTNIDCSAQNLGNGLFSLVVTVQDSSIQLDRGAAQQQKQLMPDVPAFRSFNATFGMLLKDGQTMQYASATDPVSGEVMRIDITLALAR
jgi:opacity protein-like surface antigen